MFGGRLGLGARFMQRLAWCLVDWGLLAARNGKIDDAVAALAEGLQIASQLARVPYRIAQLSVAVLQEAASAADTRPPKALSNPVCAWARARSASLNHNW